MGVFGGTPIQRPVAPASAPAPTSGATAPPTSVTPDGARATIAKMNTAPYNQIRVGNTTQYTPRVAVPGGGMTAPAPPSGVPALGSSNFGTPSSRGITLLGYPAGLRPDQWRAITEANQARVSAYTGVTGRQQVMSPQREAATDLMGVAQRRYQDTLKTLDPNDARGADAAREQFMSLYRSILAWQAGMMPNN